jgi:hypothetical protein
MKIGTWNLDADWSDAHKSLLSEADCDVWLLTEVSPETSMEDYDHHYSAHRMVRGQHYAAILSRLSLQALQDPHPASAAAVVGGITYCTSILPWSTCAHDIASPWAGGCTVENMVCETIDQLVETLPVSNLVWGGDWNQNLTGAWEHIGSRGGRARIEQALKTWYMKVPTACLSHRLKGCHSIDHIAVPMNWSCSSAISVDASGLSDHDAYIIKGEPNAARRPPT